MEHEAGKTWLQLRKNLDLSLSATAHTRLKSQVSKTCLVAAQPRWSSTKLPEQRSDDAGSADDMFHPLRCLQDGPVILA